MKPLRCFSCLDSFVEAVISHAMTFFSYFSRASHKLNNKKRHQMFSSDSCLSLGGVIIVNIRRYQPKGLGTRGGAKLKNVSSMINPSTFIIFIYNFPFQL